MQRVNEFQFYQLAAAIHPLVFANEESKYSDIWLDWSQAAETLNQIFHVRALEFCLEAATELYAAIANVVPNNFQEAIKRHTELPDPEPPIGWAAVHPIRQAVSKFETILSAELSSSDTYWVSPKGTHKTSMLMKSAHSVLPDAVTARFPLVASDFDEAGRCWIFDNYTAAGFHLMRATEAAIREYYKVLTQKEPKKKFRNWGIYLKELSKCTNANPKIIHFLDHIRDNYRNPISHPEQNLNSEEAQVLFGVCVSAISMIGSEIETLTKTGELLPLQGASALTIAKVFE